MVSSLFLRDQLKYVQTQVVEQDFPERLMASGAILPVSSEIPIGARTYSYKLLTYVGEAKILANGGDDIPMVDLNAEERVGYVRTIADGYSYTLDDLESAQYARTNLDASMAIAARDVIEAKLDFIGYDGDTANNLLGFLNHPNVPTATVLNDGTASGTTWASKTPDKIYRDLVNFASATKVATNMVEIPENIGLPVAQFEQISSTPMQTGSDTTILEMFLRTQRASRAGVQNVMPLPYLAGKGTGGTDLMISWRKRADKIKYHVPRDFDQQPTQQFNLAFKVICRASTGGVECRKPLSMRMAYGI
ncbi:MAG: DUF2184 domain-containing protein [Nodosilinea sp. WJT8-NPBG4]|jgi:hypothetical protein|nr:DUF2184 domain-containing protein [Nodosilinea sp. WJT8-NPBG4]